MSLFFSFAIGRCVSLMLYVLWSSSSIVCQVVCLSFFFFCLMCFSDLLHLFSEFVFLLKHSNLTSLLKNKNINHNYFETVDLPDNIFSLKPKELGPTLRSGRRCGRRACKSLSQLVGCASDPSVADRADNGAVVQRSLAARNRPSLSPSSSTQ